MNQQNEMLRDYSPAMRGGRAELRAPANALLGRESTDRASSWHTLTSNTP
jgi:hypothetical protein